MTRLVYILCAFSLTLSYGNLAYSEIDERLFDLSLQELLNMRVTGSTLTEQTINTAPSAVTVFDAEFISSLGVDYLHELLNYVAGFQSHRSADAPNAVGYSARGRRNGNQSKEILLVVDGQILNDPRTGSANGTVRFFNVHQIERVEVIRGPGSALYGSGAYGGVINVTTRKQENHWQIQVGQHERVALSGNAYESFNNWQLNLQVGYQDDQGEKYHLDNNFDNNPGTLTTLDPLTKRDLHLTLNNPATTLGYLYHDTRSRGFYSLEAVSNGFNANQSSMQMLYGKQEFSLRELDSYLSISLTQAEQHLDAQATAEGALFAISSPPSNDALFLKAYLKSHSLRFNWHNNWQLKQGTSIQFGLNWQVNDEVTSEAANNFNAEQLSSNEFPIDYFGDFSNVSRADRQDRQKVFGLYGQSIIKTSDANQFNLGIRFDRNRPAQSHLSPRVGWVYQINDEQIFKLLYGEAFRAASLNETANPDSPILRGSETLDNEVVKTLDVIYLYQQTQVNLQLGLFFNAYSNPIVVEISADNVRQYTNGEESSAQGVEAEINYALSNASTLRFSYFEMVNQPKEFFREAKRQASFMVNWRQHPWQGNVTVVYGGSKEMISGTEQLTLDDYVMLSGKVKYEVNSALNINVQVKNSLDEQYDSAPQGNRLIEGIPNPGREVSFQVNYRFD